MNIIVHTIGKTIGWLPGRRGLDVFFRLLVVLIGLLPGFAKANAGETNVQVKLQSR